MNATLPLRLSELLCALSSALDLSEGEPYGHAARSCLIAMRLGAVVGLDPDMADALYPAMLLKDAGGPGIAASLADMFGCDDHAIKQELRLREWTRRIEYARLAWRAGTPDRPGRRLRRAIGIAIAGPRGVREPMRMRGQRGAMIVRRLGLPEAAGEAIEALNEHWDGRGLPDGRRGEAIPLLARIALLAQTVDAMHVRQGAEAAFAAVRRRRGTWFDPNLVDALWAFRDDGAWWSGLLHDDLLAQVASAEPEDSIRYVDDSGIDEVAAAFAEIVETKALFTRGNAAEVARLSVALARTCGMGPAGQRRAHRAALLHDIGTLGVSQRVLAKPSQLTAEEQQAINRHPIDAHEILSRAPSLEEVASIAAAHHERLDGKGYPKGLTSKELDLASRILAVADVYVALISERPYRRAIPSDVALGLMRSDAEEGRFDPRIVRALARLLVETPPLVSVS